MEERLANPSDDGEGGMLPVAATSPSMPTQIIEVTVPGVNEVMRKAMDEAQEGYKAVMKEAKEDHKTRVRVA